MNSTSIPESGNQIIDYHHEKLSRIVSKLAHAWISNQNEDTFNAIVEAFIKGLSEHFDAEIDIIRRAGYERWQDHEQEHQYITKKLNRLALSRQHDYMFRFIDEAERTIFEHELLCDQEYWNVIGSSAITELIQWDDALLVHNDEIDQHHKSLISYLNRLYDWVYRHEMQKEIFLQDLTQLYSFTKAHFEHEERLFDLNSPQYGELARAHVRDHARLLSELRKTIEKFRKEIDVEEARAVMRDFIRYWMIDHILTLDKPCFEHLSSKP